MAARIDWQGATVVAKITSATLAAAREVVEEAAADARQNHWWRNRAGANLQSQIVAEPARIARGRPGVITARFGTTARRGFYGLFLERRTPFLRPAADRAFPSFATRIAARL